MDRQDRVGIGAVEELGPSAGSADLVSISDALRDDEHDGVDRLRQVLAPGDEPAFPLALSRVMPSVSLVAAIGPIILAPDDHRRLDQLVGDRCGERVAEDDLILRRVLVRRSGKSEQHPRVEVADGVEKAGP